MPESINLSTINFLRSKNNLTFLILKHLFLAELPTNFRRFLNRQEYQNIQLRDRFPLLDGFNGTPNSNQSYLILTKYDGDLKEGLVELVELMNFKVLHTWNPDFDAFNKSLKESRTIPSKIIVSSGSYFIPGVTM